MANTLKRDVRDLFKDAKRSKGAIKRLLNPSQTGAGAESTHRRHRKKTKNSAFESTRAKRSQGARFNSIFKSTPMQLRRV
jgi:hypothetical protein